MIEFHIFETEIGRAGLAWSEKGLVGAHLPERDAGVVRRSFAKRFPGSEEAPAPQAFRDVIDGVKALLRGEAVDLSTAPLDLERVADFDAKVYAIARSIPAGRTMTYGEVAAELGDRLLARDVGAALARNSWPILVPCHRVTAAGGRLGGFSARGGAKTKLRLLAIEGAAAAAQADLFG